MDRRSFLIGAGTAVVAAQAALAQEATAPIVLTDKVTAAMRKL